MLIGAAGVALRFAVTLFQSFGAGKCQLSVIISSFEGFLHGPYVTLVAMPVAIGKLLLKG